MKTLCLVLLLISGCATTAEITNCIKSCKEWEATTYTSKVAVASPVGRYLCECRLTNETPVYVKTLPNP